ncbi:MAG: BCCT family transporter, partial [Ectothiorhodospiraceae bacterium]
MANPSATSRAAAASRVGDPLVVGLSIGFVLIFLGASLVDLEGVAKGIGAGFEVTARVLGSYFQLLLLATFVIAMGLLFTPAGSARLGGLQRPEMSRFRWIAIIL